jgi:hypothetical protein
MQRSFSLGLLLMLVLVGCSGEVSSENGGDLGVVERRGPAAIAIPCGDLRDDVFKLPLNLSPFDSSHRGEIFRCAYDRYLSAADANVALASAGYAGAPVQHGMDIYLIAFRTQRSGGPEGFSSARVFLPDDRSPDAYVVVAHGTEGEGAPCVDSLKDLLDPAYNQSSKMMDLALAGAGWAVIEPDGAGYGYGQAPHGWFLAEDEAHPLLDATRALKGFLPADALPSKVAFVGHSQGSHAVLSAQALAKKYGMEGELIAVAPMALLWLSGLTWPATLSPLANLTTQTTPAAISYAMFFFYGHGELYDGPGGGLSMFQASKRDLVRSFMVKDCESDVATALPPLGATPADFYDPAFVTAMENCMILQTGCDQEPAATWFARALADRPPIDPNGAPIVVWHGAMDKDITPDRAQCGFDRIQSDLASAPSATTTFKVCGDPIADHGGVIQRDMDWVSQWIAARAAGEPDPDCPGTAPLQPADGPLTCAVPPQNL